MFKNATAFAAVWCVLSIIFAAIIFQFAMSDNSKMAQLILVNSLFLVGLGVFFIIFRDKIAMLLGNYERKKEI